MARSSIGIRAAGSSSLALGFGLLACAPETEPVEENARQEFSLELADIICSRVAPCCSDLSLPKPTDECRRKMRNEAYIAFIEAEEEHRTVDMKDAAACLSSYRAADSCAELRLPHDLQEVCPTLFSDIPDGLKNPGESCDGVYDCKSPLQGTRFCLYDSEPTPTCVWFVPTAPGEECRGEAGVYGNCEQGHVCGLSVESSSGPWLCRPPSKANEVCHTPDGCEPGYACAENETGEVVCQVAIGEGGSCIDTPLLCVFPLVCDAEEGVCRSLPILQTCENTSCPGELSEACQ
jgi:hypothetical protein